MEQAQSSAPPLPAPVAADEELKTPVVDTPAVVDAPTPVVATPPKEEPKAPEADVSAPMVPGPHAEEPSSPRAGTPGTELEPNEHDDVEIVCASPT